MVPGPGRPDHGGMIFADTPRGRAVPVPHAVLSVLAVLAGIGVGVATAAGQTHLDGVLNAFVNSASAWLVAPFLVSVLARSPGVGALAGLLTCVLEIVSYYVTQDQRGYPAGDGEVVFWAAWAVLGGPVFGAAGALWRHPRLRGLAGATLASAFLAEGVWTYGHTLRYEATAAVWLAIGFAVLVITDRSPRWLSVTLPAAFAAVIAVSALGG
jgi:hypothetical protein